MGGAAPRARIFVWLCCVAAVGISVSALEVPYLSGRVNDQAELFDEAAEAGLENKLRALEEETGAQVAVLTVGTLEGDPIEDFSLRVVETWQLGREGVDDGVLILVARDDRRMRIEVGYGLEGALTDAQSGRIVDRIMAPKFRAGDYAGGVDGAVDVISSAIRGEDLMLPEEASGGEDVDPIAGVIFLIFGLPFIWTAVGTRGVAGWMFGIFLAPFFFAFSAAVFGARIGLIVMAGWLVVFPLLRLILPKGSVGKGSKSKSGSFWGPFIGGGGGGGGFSGGSFGGFSGGGGSFGGGGASGGW